MLATIQSLFDAALQLSEHDRLELADRLFDSVPEENRDPTDDSSYLDELDQRFNDDTKDVSLDELRSLRNKA